MISLDTELMKTLVDGCITANNNIEDAVAALAGITSHSDWGCKEKTRIDEYTNTNKNKIKQLQECSNSFLSVLRQVTYDFEEAEKSIADMAGNVDASISSVISAAGGVISTVQGNMDNAADTIINQFSNHQFEDAIETAMTTITADNHLDSFVSKTICDPISVCKFADINL